MRKIELEELKKIELDMLVHLDEVCQENQINYCLCGGSLIGAIRHKGFIPWDDDIDVFMPRRDYEKFRAVVNASNSVYKVCDYTNTEDYGYPMPKMFDQRTTLIDYKKGSGEERISVFVDIFILDGMSNSRMVSVIRFNLIRILKRMVFLSKRKPIMETPLKTVVFFLPWLLCKLIGTKTINRCFDCLCKQKDLDKTQYIASCSGTYGNKEIYDKDLLSDYIRCEFEGHMINVPAKYDLLLKSVYGDYMKLPPIEKQVTHHLSEEWWNEE